MQILRSGQMNPTQLMGMFNGNPMFNQALNMIQNGGNPQDIINNIAKQKGINPDQLKQMAQQFGIKL